MLRLPQEPLSRRKSRQRREDAISERKRNRKGVTLRSPSIHEEAGSVLVGIEAAGCNARRRMNLHFLLCGTPVSCLSFHFSIFCSVERSFFFFIWREDAGDVTGNRGVIFEGQLMKFYRPDICLDKSIGRDTDTHV